jgi:hypothetical protein
MYNGKPMSHWEQMAKEIVVDVLVRAWAGYERGSKHCLPHRLAAKRLKELALAESPDLVVKLLGERDACIRGLAAILNEMMDEKKQPTLSRAMKAGGFRKTKGKPFKVSGMQLNYSVGYK